MTAASGPSGQGGRRECAKRRVARASLYAAYVRKDFAHQTSHRIVAGAPEPGQSMAQKAGLSRSILKSAWGQVKLFTHYKARRAGKLCIVVPPSLLLADVCHCQHTALD